ncbi:MAG: Pyridoxal 5'-phosphate synthase (glutamine hydrolyzing), synthase subunit, partial [uncultured Frankineae bacterium]
VRRQLARSRPQPGHRPRQARDGGDAQGRSDHGRGRRRAGEDRGGRRRRRGHGPRAGARRHPSRRRRRPHERPRHDRRHPGRRLHPGDGQGAHRPLRRGPGAAGDRRGLRRRVRGADPRRLRPPHRQACVHRAVRLRRDQPRRGAASHRRGRGHDPQQGRGRHRRRQPGHHPHPHDPRRDQAADRDGRDRAVRGRQADERPGRPGARDGIAGSPARRAVHSRRCRHPRRRGHDDAARRRRRLHRQRHLQERRPGTACARLRRGDGLLPGRRAHRQGQPRPRRGHGRHLRRLPRRRRAARHPGLV